MIANRDSKSREFMSNFVEGIEARPSRTGAITIALGRRDASLLVTVVDDLDRAVVGVDVVVWSRERTSLLTDESGQSRFVQLSPVEARVGLDESRSFAPEVCFPLDAWQSAQLVAGQEVRVQFRIARAGTIELRLSEPIDVGTSARFHVSVKESKYSFNPIADELGLGPVRIEGLGPGQYWVRCSFSPDSTQNAEDLLVTVAPGATTSAVTEIRRLSGVLLGRAVDESGAPVAGLPVWASVDREADSATTDANAFEVKRTATDANGEFRIRGLPNAPLIVQADPAEVKDRELAFIGTFDQPFLRIDKPQSDLMIRLGRGYVIRGVVRDSVAGISADGGSNVQIDRERFASKQSVTPTMRVSSDHVISLQFEFHNLRPGTYTLHTIGRAPDPDGPSVSITVGPNTPTPDALDVILLTGRSTK